MKTITVTLPKSGTGEWGIGWFDAGIEEENLDLLLVDRVRAALTKAYDGFEVEVSLASQLRRGMFVDGVSPQKEDQTYLRIDQIIEAETLRIQSMSPESVLRHVEQL